MAPQRVLLVGMPGLLRDIVRETLSGHDDIELVDNPRCVDPHPAIRSFNPGTVVWCTPQAPGERALRELLYAHPRLRILTVVGEGRRGNLHQLVPHTSALREISPQRLLSAVRGRAGETDQ